MNAIISKVLFSVVYLSFWAAVAAVAPKYWASGILVFGFVSWALIPSIISFFSDEERFVEISVIALGLAGCVLAFVSVWYVAAFQVVLYAVYKGGMFNSIHRALSRKTVNGF